MIPRHPLPRAVAASVLALICAAALSACATAAHPISSPSARAASPSPTPTITTGPTLNVPVTVTTDPAAAADVLFTVTGTYVSPWDGAKVAVAETVHAGVRTATAVQRALIGASSVCTPELQKIASPLYFRVTVTKTVLKGAMTTDDKVTALSGTRYTAPGFLPGERETTEVSAGDPTPECIYTQVSDFPAEGVAVYPAATAASLDDGWLGGFWGTSVGREAAGDSGEEAWLTDSCVLAVGPAATSVTFPETWKTSINDCGVGTPPMD